MKPWLRWALLALFIALMAVVQFIPDPDGDTGEQAPPAQNPPHDPPQETGDG